MSDGASVNFVIVRMRPDKSNEDDAGIEVDFHDQTVGVSLDVKDDPVAGQNIRRRVAALDFVRAGPYGNLHFVEPRIQSGFAVGVLFIKLAERLAGNDPHLHYSSVSRGKQTKSSRGGNLFRILSLEA
jgi:hypothetical protein